MPIGTGDVGELLLSGCVLCQSGNEVTKDVDTFNSWKFLSSPLLQIFTRLVATSSPVMYWYAAHLLIISNNHVSHCDDLNKQWFAAPRTSYLVLAFFAGYAYLGLALHTNFYPWT